MHTQRTSARRAALPFIAAFLLGLCSACPLVAYAQSKPPAPLGALPPLAPAGQVPAAPAVTPDAVAAPAAASSTSLYAGQTADQAGLTATAWGGGGASITTERAFSPGTNSIKITTRGLYQGGRLTLASPAMLGDLTADKTRYLQLALGFVAAAPDSDNPEGGTQSAPGGPQYPGGGAPAPQDRQEGLSNAPARVFTAAGRAGRFRLAQGPGRYQGGPPRGFRPPPGYPGTPDGVPRPRSDDQTLDILQPPIKSLHLTFAFADGSETDVVRPVPSLEAGDNWLELGIPLSQVPVPASQAHDARLQSITIAGDAPTTLYIGQIRMVSDPLPITCSTGGEQDVARGDTVVFKGKAQAGAANIRYEWDFDTKSDFISQAEGREVTHVYTQSGSYKVTLRVSDVDGIKAPATSTTTIHIED